MVAGSHLECVVVAHQGLNLNLSTENSVLSLSLEYPVALLVQKEETLVEASMVTRNPLEESEALGHQAKMEEKVEMSAPERAVLAVPVEQTSLHPLRFPPASRLGSGRAQCSSRVSNPSSARERHSQGGAYMVFDFSSTTWQCHLPHTH